MILLEDKYYIFRCYFIILNYLYRHYHLYIVPEMLASFYCSWEALVQSLSNTNKKNQKNTSIAIKTLCWKKKDHSLINEWLYKIKHLDDASSRLFFVCLKVNHNQQINNKRFYFIFSFTYINNVIKVLMWTLFIYS